MKARKSATKVDPEEFLKVFLLVRGGTLTAKAAALRLGISRKTYYEWEARAFKGLMGSLRPKAAGRPTPVRDPASERLKEENQRLSRQVLELEQTLEIRRLLAEVETRAQKKQSGHDRGKEHPEMEETGRSVLSAAVGRRRTAPLQLPALATAHPHRTGRDPDGLRTRHPDAGKAVAPNGIGDPKEDRRAGPRPPPQPRSSRPLP